MPILTGLDRAGLFGEVVKRTAADPASGRLPLWLRGPEPIAAHPLFGVGPMHFGHYGVDSTAPIRIPG